MAPRKCSRRLKPAAGDVKDGVEIAAAISSAISKTKAFKAKDIASAVKKVKAGKIAAGSFKPVKAATAKAYGMSATVLLRAMNEGMLKGSKLFKVIAVAGSGFSKISVPYIRMLPWYKKNLINL